MLCGTRLFLSLDLDVLLRNRLSQEMYAGSEMETRSADVNPSYVNDRTAIL